MKIIVCGAGRIGKNIVSYLSYGNNDISVIDTDQQKLDEVAKEWDVLPILGNAAHPEILEKAGAENADMILALTNSDEVNMIACQVVDYLFHIRKKIARIDAEAYQNPIWCDLYNPNHINIDLIIFPDMAIADAIYGIIKVPGASSVMPLGERNIYMLSIKCNESCPLIKTSIEHIGLAAPEIKLAPVSVVRNGKNFIPTGEFCLEAGDELFFLVAEEDIEEALHSFGTDHPSNEKVVIFGGNQISLYLAQKLEEDDNIISCKIIEEDRRRAAYLARVLEHTSVVCGELLSDIMLEEADVEETDVTISTTLRDKDNLLASLIAKKNGAHTTISLVNSNSYNTLVSNLNDSIIVDSASVTISEILKELRKAKISKAYSLGQGYGEVWEINIDETSMITDKKIVELDLPENSKVCAIIRNDEIIFPEIYERILEGDRLIVYCASKAIKKVEKIFS